MQGDNGNRGAVLREKNLISALSAVKDNIEERVIDRAIADFLFFTEHYVWTVDEHDTRNPIKRLPITTKPYLRELALVWTANPLLLMWKSRQMMVSWLMCAAHLWLVLGGYGRRVAYISRRAEEADKLVDRSWFIYQQLPERLRARYPRANKKEGFLVIPELRGEIMGCSQDSDAPRSYTFTAIFCDEMPFQERASRIYIAARPTIMGGGRFTGVGSTKMRSFFTRLIMDEI